MKWAWRLGRFADIDVYIHATFLLIIAFVAWSHWARGLGVPGIVEGMMLLVGLWGLFGNPMLLFIALFIRIGATQEASMLQMKSELAGISGSRSQRDV